MVSIVERLVPDELRATVPAGDSRAPVATSRGWQTAARQPRSAGRNRLRGGLGLHVAAVAVRIVRAIGRDGPPTIHRVDEGPRVGKTPPPGPRRARFPRRVGLVPLRDRLGEHADPEKGKLTGPNPVDRGTYGSKIHLITERTGLPPSVALSGANLHDSQAQIPRVKDIPPIRSWHGRRRRRPAKLHPDQGYDHDHLRRWLRRRGIRHQIARKGIKSSTRLGRHRWTIERTMS